MKVNYRPLGRAVALTGVAAIALMAGTAQAQDDAEPADEDAGVEYEGTTAADLREIVVTGTLIRGIAPTGASPVTVSSEAIEETGATSVAQVLETIPQLGSFGQFQAPLAESQEVSINRPNLRSLPGFNTSGGSTTLVLMDGHRIVGMGNATTVPDPDIIPPGVLERVEIVPDGGSAIYGSDAVAGVLNFVTIKRFDGLKVDGSYGFADDYYRWDANVTAGRDWGEGSAYISYNYAKSDDLLGIDRDYVREYPNAQTGLTTLQCDQSNITALAGAYVSAGSITGANGGDITQCDISDYATVYPESERHSVFAGLTQQLNDSLAIEIRGFYTNRKTHIQNGPFTESVRTGAFAIPGIAVQSPFAPYNLIFTPDGPVVLPGGVNSFDLVQQVDFQFGANDADRTDIALDTWGITPTLTADIGGGFQLRVLGNYGESMSNFRGTDVNEPALNAAVAAGLFNPFDPESSDPAALAAITNFGTFGRTRQNFYNARAVVDGDLFELPAGAVKIAAGLEYYKEEFNTQNGTGVPGFESTGYEGQTVNGSYMLGDDTVQSSFVVAPVGPIPRYNLGRNVKSAFGELVVPLIATDDGLELRVSLQGRYDDYSDVGDTFNPRIGVTFNPTDWISFNAAWGESFNAPSLADAETAAPTTVFVLTGQTAGFFAPPSELVEPNGPFPVYNGGNVIAVRGNAPGITPQTAETWTVGVELEPPFIPGLFVGVSYYNLSVSDLIGLAPFQNPARLYGEFPFLVSTDLTQQQIDDTIALADVLNGPGSSDVSSTYAIFDARKRNLGEFRADGLDLRLAYRTDFDFGAIFLNANGNVELTREQSGTPGAPFLDLLDANSPGVRFRTTAGAEVGPVTGQITWNHTGGYDLVPAVGFDGTTIDGVTYTSQTSVDAYDTFDAYFRWEVGGEGLGEDLAFSLTVQNIFDKDPPVYRGGTQVAGRNGVPEIGTNTLGRLFQFGVSKKF